MAYYLSVFLADDIGCKVTEADTLVEAEAIMQAHTQVGDFVILIDTDGVTQLKTNEEELEASE